MKYERIGVTICFSVWKITYLLAETSDCIWAEESPKSKFDNEHKVQFQSTPRNEQVPFIEIPIIQNSKEHDVTSSDLATSTIKSPIRKPKLDRKVRQRSKRSESDPALSSALQVLNPSNRIRKNKQRWRRPLNWPCFANLDQRRVQAREGESARISCTVRFLDKHTVRDTDLDFILQFSNCNFLSGLLSKII